MTLEEKLQWEREKFRSILRIAQAVGSTLDLDLLLRLIVNKVTELMDADRSTLYVMNEAGTELWTRVLQAENLREIRLRVGEGIAGWVAATGRTVNIADAYADTRFNPEVDQRSGYRTRTILCTPMVDNQGRITGVVQVLNKRGGTFDAADEELLQALSSHASIAIENSKLYLSMVRQNAQLMLTQEQLERRARELDMLLEVERQVTESSDMDELLDNLLVRTTELIGAEASSVLLQDQTTRRLYFSSATGEVEDAVRKVSMDPGQGLAGWVVEHGKPALVNDPAADPRHDRDMAENLGLVPRNILCVPLAGRDQVLGAVELLNKIGGPRFDDDDLTLLTLVAGRISHAIELAQARESHMNQERLAAIGQMLAGVLHDLKTPMTIASGYAQLMAQNDEEDTRRHFMEQVLKQFSVMSAMTQEVLAFARGESNVLIRKVYLHRMLPDVEEHLVHLLKGKGITLNMDVRYKGVAYMDEAKFRRVFHNIAQNAAEAMPAGGAFTLSVEAEDDRLLFRLSDTGQGIPAEVDGHLFELFATAGKVNGTGLGLAIVQKIVKEHDGEITYASRPGEGTTFTISLPLVRSIAVSGEWPAVTVGTPVGEGP